MTATTPSPAKITKRKSVKLLLKKLGGTFSSGTDALRTHSSSEERTPRYPMSDTVEKLEKTLDNSLITELPARFRWHKRQKDARKIHIPRDITL